MSDVRNLVNNVHAHEGYALTVGYTTYNDALMKKGLLYLKDLVDEQKDSLFLVNARYTGGVEVSNRIKYVGLYSSYLSYIGIRLDQLILIDDERMQIYKERADLIETVWPCLARSYVPRELQLMEVIW